MASFFRDDWQDQGALDMRPSAPPMRRGAQMPVSQRSGGFGGLLGGIARSIAEVPAYFINAAVVNPTKELAAQATGNKLALRNARMESNRELGLGSSGQDLEGGLKKWAGNTAQLAAMAVPVGKAASVGGKLATGAGTGAVYGGGASLAGGGSLEDVLSGAVQGGAIGGVLGAGPVNLMKGAAGGTKAVVRGGNVLQAANQAAGASLRGKAGQAISGAADDLAVKNFRLTPTQLTNFKNKFGEDAGQTIRKYGFTSADDVATKGIEPLQQQFDDAIVGIPGVTKEALKKNFEKRVTKLSNAGPADMQSMGKQLKQEADSILKRYGDVVDANELNMIRRQFDDLVNYTEKTANPARYGVNKRMADSIRETLQQADPSGNLKTVGRELQKLRQLSDNVSRQEQLGRGSLLMNLPTLLGGTMGGAAVGPAGAIGSAAATAAVNSPTGRRAAMKGAEKLGGQLMKSGERAAMSNGQAGLRKGLTIGALAGMNNQPQTLEAQLTGSSPADMYAQDPMNPDFNGVDPAQFGYPEDPTVQAEQSPYTRENLMFDIQRDPKNRDEYIKYYAQLQEVFAPPETQSQKPLSQGQQERADLIKALGNTESLMSQGSINYGPIGSRIEGVKSLFNAADPETLAFKNTISGLRAAITKARAGASLTEGELRMLQKYTPSETDTEQVVRSKLQQLRSLYGYSAPTGGTTLEDALMSQQQQMY